jgi:hypothetical protein
MADYNMGTLTLDADDEEGLDLAIWSSNKAAQATVPPGTIYNPALAADRQTFCKKTSKDLFKRYGKQFQADFKQRNGVALDTANRTKQNNVAAELGVVRNPYTTIPPTP